VFNVFDRAILIVFGYYFPVLLPGCSGSCLTCYHCKWLTGESRSEMTESVLVRTLNPTQSLTAVQSEEQKSCRTAYTFLARVMSPDRQFRGEPRFCVCVSLRTGEDYAKQARSTDPALLYSSVTSADGPAASRWNYSSTGAHISDRWRSPLSTFGNFSRRGLWPCMHHR